MSNIQTLQNMPPVAAISKVTQIKNFLKANYTFRYNEVISSVEWSKDSVTFQRLTDRKENTLVLELEDSGIQCSPSLLHLILHSEFSQIHNPITTFLDSLSPWDETDYIKQLANTVKTTDDICFEIYLRKWLVSAVACWYSKEAINHTALILCGGQGIGKTTWCKRLIPPDMRAYFYSGPINPGEKDSLVHLTECMLINLDELGSLNDKTTASLKELLTKGHVKFRKPYGRHSELFIRRASFIGSVNSREYLSDETGNRRFLSVEVEGIDYDHQIDMRNVYAQALHLYKTDFKFWFSNDEHKEINERNREFLEISAEEELLFQYFESCNIADASQFLTTTEILNDITKGTRMSLNQGNKKRLGQVLKAKGFQQTAKRNRKVWAVKQKSGQLLEALNGTGASIALN